MLEEARKRDHRVVGDHQKLFIISPLVGKGLPLWLPRGATLRDTLERWLREVQIDNGYLPVVTPHIGNLDLYRTSGHYPYYADSQYAPIDVDDQQYLLKPMVPASHHDLQSEPRSYKDLPVRYAEFGTVYRYEQSGELHGLTRVRGFTVDDAHLFVTPEQLLNEFKSVVRLIQYALIHSVSPDYRARVGIRDPKVINTRVKMPSGKPLRKPLSPPVMNWACLTMWKKARPLFMALNSISSCGMCSSGNGN
ncbi:hypothetical protein MASR2M15_29290 [Anaerolineales bacterium]